MRDPGKFGGWLIGSSLALNFRIMGMESKKKKGLTWCFSDSANSTEENSCREWNVSKRLQVLDLGWVLSAEGCLGGLWAVSTSLGRALLPGTINILFHSQQDYEVGSMSPFTDEELRVREK